ncbi:hypothetical protein K7472_07630 [Streptomyces sp. PTM05]|uniref:Thioesterase domain-containing protein n=1 Tax=Streptantibioticus parmotrematis TaxID=2873249 RepID=A0ABS7QSE4_9ACTN|nr:thioesterase domain-containing protein [Streptantibioticus parmotrematis]MBY8884714.1 hypothetical protein [Streptantibioticus parmotrematis]
MCIPWAGAGATPFHAWGPVIGDAAAVYGVRLAGRESRQVEPPATSLADVVTELVEELSALGASRVALFGQCSGALTAFEVARALTSLGSGPELVQLFVASQLPPRVLADRRLDPSQDPARYVPEHLRGEPELMEVLLPILTADMELVAKYAYMPGAPLGVPLTAVYGELDDDLDRTVVDGWRHETTGETVVHEIAGADHLFGGAAWLDLARSVRSLLS